MVYATCFRVESADQESRQSDGDDLVSAIRRGSALTTVKSSISLLFRPVSAFDSITNLYWKKHPYLAAAHAKSLCRVFRGGFTPFACNPNPAGRP